MKKYARYAVVVALAFILVGCSCSSGMSISGPPGMDDGAVIDLNSTFIGAIKAEFNQVMDGYLFFNATLDEAIQRDVSIEVIGCKPVGNSNFQFVIRVEDGDDIVLYDYDRDGADYQNAQTIEIPAAKIETQLAGDCQSAAMLIEFK